MSGIPKYMKITSSELRLSKCLERLPKGTELPVKVKKSGVPCSFRALGKECGLDKNLVEKYLHNLVEKPLGESGKKIVFEKKTTEVLILDPEEDPYDEMKRNARNAFHGIGVVPSQLKNFLNPFLPPMPVVCRCGCSRVVIPLFDFHPLSSVVPCLNCQKPLYMKCNCGEFLFVNGLSEGEPIICNCGRAHIKKGGGIETLDT